MKKNGLKTLQLPQLKTGRSRIWKNKLSKYDGHENTNFSVTNEIRHQAASRKITGKLTKISCFSLDILKEPTKVIL